MKKKTFVTIFDRTKNFHLVKDVGQIPFHMYKEFAYESTIVTCKNDNNYTFLDNEVKGLQIKFIPKLNFFGINLGVIIFLIKNSKKIDILHQFHIRHYTLFYSFIFKIFNKKGITYIKADADEKSFEKRGYIVKKKYIKTISRYVNCISFETKKVVKIFLVENPCLNTKVIHVPNGIDRKYLKKFNLENINCYEKENIILYVARIGTHQKNTELFLNAIEKVNLNDWKVYILGEIEEYFHPFIKSFFDRNKKLKEKIIFHGNINNREEIYKYYKKSKIFCLSSRYEGFPLVFPEAIYFGNYIVTTDVSGSYDITRNSDFGKIIKGSDPLKFASVLNELISSNELTIEKCKNIKLYARQNFTWQVIVEKLNHFLESK